MTWVRLDDGFYQHPKIVRVGVVGMALQVAALCYANHNLTDGFIPSEAVAMLVPGANGVVAKMVRVGLWDEAEDGYLIHDYTKYQWTKAQIETFRAQKQAAGQAGGQASAKARGQAKSNPIPHTSSFDDEETDISCLSSSSKK